MSKEYRYKLMIKTIYNTINLEVDDIYTEEIQELLSQPYIVEVNIERVRILRRK